MPSTTRQGQPDAPRWVYLPTSVDLKVEVLRRIEAYYQYEENAQATSEKWYKEWMDGTVNKMTATKVCSYAVNSLKLNTVKFVSGTQLSKRTMVLQPFTADMEYTRGDSNLGKTESTSTRSDEFTEIEVESATEDDGRIVIPDTQTTMNTQPSVVEGNSTMEGEMIMLPNNDKGLNTIIINVVDRHLHDFKTTLMQEIGDEIRKTLREVIQDNATMKNVIKTTRDELMQTFTNDVNELKSNIVENIQSEISSQMKDAVQNIHAERQNVIKTVALKRDRVLVDINEEANQAIEDFQSAMEQLKTRKHTKEIHDIEVYELKEPTKSTRFPNVDLNNLKVEQDIPIRNVATSNRQAQPTWSLYGFHKHFKAKLRNDTQILNFYQQLFKQGSPYGVHCIPLHDIRPNIDLCPPHHQRQRNEMTLTIYQKLQDEDCVSVGYKKAQRLIQQYAASSDGYRVMEQLLRSVHPNLMHSTANTYEVPKLSNSYGNLYDYGSKIMNYILMQGIQHRKYTQAEQTIMFLNNMDDDKYYEAKNRALAEIRQITSSGSTLVDPNLMLESLPTTLEQYHEQIHGNSVNKPQRQIRSLYDHDQGNSLCEDVDDDGDHAIIRTFGRRRDKSFSYNNRNGRNQFQQGQRNDRSNLNKQCKACGRWGCNERKCQFVAKVQLAVTFIKEHGNAAAKLAEEYLRTNDRRTRMSTIRTLTANLSDMTSSYPTDEELLNQYDLEIPMEEIDFDIKEE